MDRVAVLHRTQIGPQRRGRGVVAPLVWIFAPVLAHRRELGVLNALYFGTVVLAAAYAALNPELQMALLQSVGQAFSPSGALGPLVRAYTDGQLATAIGLTFVVNLVLGSAVMLTLPSIVVPFAGVAIGLYRAFLWGVLFAPTSASALGDSTIVALPTILLEGEAYVVALLGVWLWWSSVMRAPGGRWRAWKHGLLLQARIYPAVALVLALAAIYEALSVILMLS